MLDMLEFECCAPPVVEEEDEKTRFTYAELSKEAKERAFEREREAATDIDWWLDTYREAETIVEMMGITFDTRTARLMGGGVRQDPSIWFSGFWSQGDGACFEGSYAPAADAGQKVREYAPQDEKLHTIADALDAIAKRTQGTIRVKVTHSGTYCHEYTTSFGVEFEGEEDLNDFQQKCFLAIVQPAETERDVTEALRSFMRWIYAQLQAEYEHLTSEEVVAERLADLTFDEDGDEI